MSENKTKPTDASVDAFLETIDDPQRREDCRQIARMMARATGHEPRMWGDAIVGFGRYHYVYDSGREGDWFEVGFSPRKQAITLYLMGDLDGKADLLARLGKHKTGKSCLYINRLSDVDAGVLEELIDRSVENIRRTPHT